MLGIFLWSFLSGAVTVVAAQAKIEVTRASKETQQGLLRARKQAEVQDLMSRL